jgi:protein-tyrosine phosphatase
MANEIIPNLWLGNIIDSKNDEFIKDMDIIINCSKDIPFQNPNKKNIRIFVEDNLEKVEIINLYRHLDKITKYMHTNLINGKKILVHCYAGKQRSASIVVAYLMRVCNIPLTHAIELLKSKRIIVFNPLCNFEGALKLFEENLKNKEIQ